MQSLSLGLLVDVNLVAFVHVVVHDLDFCALVVEFGYAVSELAVLLVSDHIAIKFKVEDIVVSDVAEYFTMCINVYFVALLLSLFLSQ